MTANEGEHDGDVDDECETGDNTCALYLTVTEMLMIAATMTMLMATRMVTVMAIMGAGATARLTPLVNL